MQSKCRECGQSFESQRSLHTLVKKHSMLLGDYYVKHYQRKNKLTGELLPFKNYKDYSILDISIHTGRTHQIRVHLSSKKLPIVGDNTYDPGRSIAKDSSDKLIEIIRSFPRQALHARFLSFTCHKTKNEISFNIQNPLDMKNLISDIKKHS